MNSTTSGRFWRLCAALPVEARKQARKAYLRFAAAPYHPSLHFKRIHSARPVFSVRVGVKYRAVGILDRDEITWFWIGTHADYDKVLSLLRAS